MLKLKINLCFLIILTALASCERKNPQTVKLTVQFDKAKNARIDIISNNLLNLDTILITTSNLDSLGSGTVEFALDHPVFALISSADRRIPVYLSPGDKLAVRPDTSKKGSGFQFSGDGASVQKFIRLCYDAKDKYEMMNGKYSIQAEEKDFLARRDSLQKAYAVLLANLANDKTVEKKTIDIMAFMHKASLYFFQQNYVMAQYDDDQKIPESIRDFLKDFPLDTNALSANMYDYGLVLNTYLRTNIYDAAGKIAEDWDDAYISEVSEAEINKGHYPKPLKEYFRAANINFWVRMEGLSPELEKLKANFFKEVKTPLYTSTINKSFDQWAPLAAGKPAPDFAGTMADGKKVSLSSLKGKVVYVDVWATWCVPCREEFPNSKKLISEFEGNKKVAFLFLSTDSDRDKWRKLLTDKSIPEGIHIHQKQDGQPDAIWENYLLWGIPRYILIDADGKMLQAHAPRPGSAEIRDLLRSTVKY